MIRTPLRIQVEGLDHSFGHHQVLHDINLDVSAGARLGIVGESGSGKTTLARLLGGALGSSAGAVTVNSAPWSAVRRGSPTRRAVQLIYQDPYASLTPHVSVGSAVREAARVCRRLSRRKARAHAEELLASVGISPALAGRRPRQLSGGQCQRVAIARTLAADPDLIIADEPTSALDISVQAQIINLLLDIMTRRGAGLVLVSHDLAVIRHLTEEVVVMHEGRIVERGATASVLTAPKHPYTRQLCDRS